MGRDEAEALATRLLAAGEGAGQLPEQRAGIALSLAEAYRVSARIAELRIARGERPVGWKVGFTNRNIWNEYGVRAPIWGPMWDTTVAPIGDGTLALEGLCEPRIEPEIAVRLARAPEPGMSAADLAACIEGVAHGIEIVQSAYPGWRFTAAETVAAQALHGRFRHGSFVHAGEDGADGLAERLAAIRIELRRGGQEIDTGEAADVLGGPLEALRHFVDNLALTDYPLRIRPGDIVTTGTVTRAFPVTPGETWSTRVAGMPLEGLTIRFT